MPREIVQMDVDVPDAGVDDCRLDDHEQSDVENRACQANPQEEGDDVVH